MDLLNGSTKYQRYLARIDEYKKIVDRNEAFSAIQSRVDQMSIELTTKKDRLFYQYAHQAILAVCLAIGILAVYQSYYFLGFLLIIGAVALKIVYNRTLKGLIQSTEHEHELEASQKSFDLQLFHKMQYLRQGVEVKMARITIVRNCYMVLFPFMMIAGSLLLGALSSMFLFAPVIVAFMMGTIFWFYFFKDDLDDLDYEEMELETYINDFLKASENRLTEQAMNYTPENVIIDLKGETNTSASDKAEDDNKDTIQLSLKI